MSVMSFLVSHSITNFSAQSISYPLGEQKRYTFKSFKEEVDGLAASLLELGFEKSDRFAVWLPNTSQNVAMTYAASKLGLIKVSRYCVDSSISEKNNCR